MNIKTSILVALISATFFCPSLFGQELMTSSNFVYKAREDVKLTSLIRTRTNIGDNYPSKKTDNELRIGETITYTPVKDELDLYIGQYMNKIDKNVYNQRTFFGLIMYPIKIGRLKSINRLQYDYNYAYSNGNSSNDRVRILLGATLKINDQNKITTSYEYLTTTETRYVAGLSTKISNDTYLLSSLEVRKWPGYSGNPIIIIGFKHKLN